MIQIPRGTKDIFCDEAYAWSLVENIIKKNFLEFNFSEIRTPMFEHTELFNRSAGENSDIVRKEMYTFCDRSGRSLTLKPEGTAPIVRAALENNLFESNPKLFYITSAFRYERPQAGRYREFHQCGAESFGDASYYCDAEIICLANKILYELGLENIALKINSIGCDQCRRNYNLELKNFLASNLNDFCHDCKNRFESNTLRILDCKVESCKKLLLSAPSILDFLCDDCKNHFEALKDLLDKLNINFEVDNKIVRGLDYYNKTVFEFIYNNITVCGGGRYDNLVFELGNKKIPAVGFGFGLERLILAMKSQNLFDNYKPKIDLFIGNFDIRSREKSFLIANNLRAKNFKIEYNNYDRSLKSQVKSAIKLNSNFFIAIGDQELESNKIKIKDLNSRSETQIDLNLIDKFLLDNNIAPKNNIN